MPQDNELIMNAALPDTRPQSEKDKDYHAEEVGAAGAVTPFQNPKLTKLPASVYSQERTSSCVPHGFLTQLEYEGIVLSAPRGMSQIAAYRKRSNYPAPGSNAVDLYTKIKEGQRLNLDAPVFPGMTEAEANAMQNLKGELHLRDFNYFDYRDYSLVPSDVAMGKAIAVFIYATNDEWAQEYVEIKDSNLDSNEAAVRHCVCIVPLGDFTENGKKWLAVHDSAKFGGRHLRYVEYGFFLKRTYYASKVYAKGDIPVPIPAPVQLPLVPCELNQKNDAVRNLQAYLIKEGYLGKEFMTGFYGALTAKAVLWWQLERYSKFVGGVPQLLDWGGKYWGPQSINIIK